MLNEIGKKKKEEICHKQLFFKVALNLQCVQVRESRKHNIWKANATVPYSVCSL